MAANVHGILQTTKNNLCFIFQDAKIVVLLLGNHIFFIMSKLASRALELFMQQRRLAESDNGQELSLDEINEEIRAVRKGRRQ